LFYTYNAVNFPTQLTNPDSETTSYEYDALGRRTKITNANTTTANFSGKKGTGPIFSGMFINP